MSSITGLIAELVLAADDVGKLSAYEKVRLLDRAITTIHDIREKLALQSSGVPADDIAHLRMTRVASARAKRTPDRFQAALLDAADLIRALHNAVDTQPATDAGEGTMH